MASSPLSDMKKLPSMKLSNKPKTEKLLAEPARPEYPYGLRLSLNQETLKKVGLSVKGVKVKDKLMVMAEAEVCEIRSSSDEYSDNENMELKITNMAVAPKKMRRS